MIFSPVSNRRGRPESLLAAPRLSWARAYAYRATLDGGLRISSAGAFLTLCPSSYAAATGGSIAVNTSGALRARRF